MSATPKSREWAWFERVATRSRSDLLNTANAHFQNTTDLDKLANIDFYMHHPELNGRPLRNDEIKLIAEWKSFRTKIAPLVPIWVKVYSQLEEPKYYGTLLPDLGPPLISSFSVSGHGGD